MVQGVVQYLVNLSGTDERKQIGCVRVQEIRPREKADTLQKCATDLAVLVRWFGLSREHISHQGKCERYMRVRICIS